MTFLVDVLQTIWAIYSFLSFKAKFKRKNFDGINIDYCWKLVPRWYSPFYWILILIMTVVVFLFNGLRGIKEFFADWKGYIWNVNENDTSGEISVSNSFKENISSLKKQWLLFIKVYGVF